MIVDLLRIAPKRALTRAIGTAARLSLPKWLRAPAYGTFARRVGADLSEADRPIDEYASFQDFFARRLRDGIRPLADSPIVSPVDGTIVSAGVVESGRLFQIKGHEYALADLLGDAEDARALELGRYITFYLHPRNYHRIHAPIDGVVTKRRHMPGRLFPVNEEATRKVPGLFATNERIATLLTGGVGRVAVVKVAAFGVGTVETFYREGQAVLRGQEIATFLMGSTVILVAEPQVELECGTVGRQILLGQSLMRDN